MIFSSENYAGLTPAQVERLAMLAEECSEIAQIAMKIIRHGYLSYNPHDPKKTSNLELLLFELQDLQAVHCGMLASQDLPMRPSTPKEVTDRWKQKLRYTHHQGPIG